MDPTRLSLFDLADRRLAWLDQRQTVLAQNIANAATPGWTPRDLPAFDASLAHTLNPALARTDAAHLKGTQDDLLQETQRRPSSRAPDGNGVALDEELTRIADSETAHALVTNIYKKYLGMFSLALGRSP
jgi:flagellar basal-body rod protein FlgB